MMEALKPYAEYKESGVSWLGNVPEHWIKGPGFAAFREKQVKNTGMREKTVLSLSYGKIIVKPLEKLHGLVPESFETYQIVEPGDIIIRSTDLQNDWKSLRVGLVRDQGIITSAYICFKTTDMLIPEYGYLLLHALDLMKIFYGLGSGLRQNLSFIDFKRMLIFVPPIPEQSAIIQYLGTQDRRINHLIHTKRRLIELLNEQKQAIIHQAVTRGLDPNVKLKPSGIEWLGDVPEHWDSNAVKRNYMIQLGKMLQNQSNEPNDVEVPYLKAQHIQWFSVRTTNAPKMWANPREIEQFGIRRGDLLVCEGGEGGRCCLVGDVEPGHIIQNALHRVRPMNHSRNEYLQYVMSAVSTTGWFEAINNKATIAHFTKEKFGSLRIPFPPRPEQAVIVEYLDNSFAEIDIIIDRAHREIALLREYRIRLISDVVTGKLDVRSVELPALGETETLEDKDIDEDTEAEDLTDTEEDANDD